MNNRNVRKQPKKVVFLEKQQRITKMAINKMDVQEFNNSHEWQYFGHSGRIGFYLLLDRCWQT